MAFSRFRSNRTESTYKVRYSIKYFMTAIIKSYHTTGLCGTCYRELLATIEYRSDGAAYITKTCPVHGYEEAMVEKDYTFWESALQTIEDNRTWNTYNNSTAIEVTDRCNLKCKHCYHDPDNKIKDAPAELIISKALSVPTPDVTFMGAEPTMREDLCYIIREIKRRPSVIPKTVSIYTNGVNLKDPEYVKELIDAGLDVICMSIHNPEYHKESIWKNIDKALQNIANTTVMLGQLSFTVENKEEVNHAIDKIMWLKSQDRLPHDFCIRSPAQIGVEYEEYKEIFASEIFTWISEIAAERGLDFAKHPNMGSNPYHIGTVLNGIHIQVIHWATVKSLDTSYMYMGPWASFIPNTRGTFLLQAILRDGWKKGWWQGERIAPELTQPIHFKHK